MNPGSLFSFFCYRPRPAQVWLEILELHRYLEVYQR